ncbi:MAG: DUF4038 domain-containing protein [Sedimentisphaerales bacterium]
MKKLILIIIATLLCSNLLAVSFGKAQDKQDSKIEKWGFYELSLPGPSAGKPFIDIGFSAVFKQGDRTFEPEGFYDGNGIFKIRFMPDKEGIWTFKTKSNREELNGKKGQFECIAPSTNNHGPVHVANTFHFAYADGKPYKQLGTTCYAWIHQTEALEEQTLKTLATAPFNKLRMCVFPKRYSWNKNEPRYYPFEGNEPNHWDFTRFNPEFFQHLEKRVGQLRDLGIEADIILFHPYDKGHWGFDRMPAEVDDRYLHYVIARLGAYRNVWWSLANEYDFMKEKRESDWDRFFQIVQAKDPYQHLRSIHNGTLFYNHNQPWVTHASIQSGAALLDYSRAVIYRDVYRKPIVFDEVKYEGNIPKRWGNISAEELVLRFWNGVVAGTYVGHGETLLDPNDVLWWSKGGVLKGQSPARLAFLRKIMDDGPADGLDPIDRNLPIATGGKRGEYYLIYFGTEARTSWPFELYKAELADGMKFTAEVIDTWNMTITPVEGVFTLKKKDDYFFANKDARSITLPGKPYMAIRIKRVKE